MRKRSVILAHALLRTWLCCALLSVAPIFLRSQEPPLPPEAESDVPLNPSGPLGTVRGLVLNAATGQPLVRALVKIDSPLLGVLTDSEGRFEIAGVPSGVHSFWVIKPGFQDPGEADDAPDVASHMVTVAAEMPELTFRLTPMNAIFGHVTLSSDSAAVGVGLTLLRRTVENGRAEWARVDTHQTTPSGAFRFSGLRDGTYVILTEPQFENGNEAGSACNDDGPGETPGYASRFYNDTQELASAARLVVAGGQNAEVTLALNLTQFHLVTLALLHAPAGGNWSFLHELYGQNGQPLEYPVREMQDHSLCVYLPDGSYTLAMEATAVEVDPATGRGQRSEALAHPLAGVVEFSLDGHALRRLRIPLAEDAGTQVHVRYEPGPPKPLPKAGPAASDGVEPPGQADVDEEEAPNGDVLSLSAERLNSAWLQGRGGMEADRLNEGTYVLRGISPGAYWIEAGASRPDTCMGAVTAGGVDLSRTTWNADGNGAGPPIDAVVRTDCGTLTVELPPAAESAGEDRPIFVYAVPEFDSIGGILEASTADAQLGENKVEIPNATPGAYRIYAFHRQRSIEFRNPDALEHLGGGQEVTLDPSGSASVAIQAVSE